MTERHWTDELSDYLNDDLPQAKRLEVEAHLSACVECRAMLEDLRAVIARAGDLQDAPPESDLWAGIAQAIGTAPQESAPRETAPQEDDRVIDLSTRLADSGPVEVDRRIRLTVPQLVAASVIMMMASGAMAWSLRPVAQGTRSVGDPQPAVVLPASLADRPTPAGYTQEVAQLEALMAEHRDELTPNTVRILEKNLAIIDRAIEESGKALAADPENEYLLEHLGRTFQRKVDYLRDASAISGWVTG